MSLLNRPLELWDVRDTEALCARVIQRSRFTFSYHDEEELLTYLVEEAWRLSLRYEPGKGSTTTFAGWATTNLRRKLVDWQRQRFGRRTWKFKDKTVTRELPAIVSLDRDGGERELDRLVTGGPLATSTGGAQDLARVLREGSRSPLGDYD